MQYNPELGGKHTLINVETGEYVFAKQLEEARTLFKNKFGEKIKPFLFLG